MRKYKLGLSTNNHELSKPLPTKRLYVLLLVSLVPGGLFAEPSFVGAEHCRSCHADAYADWQQSDHAKAQQVASEATVLGDFSGVEVDFHSIKSRLYRKEGTFLIDTRNREGETRTFPILYTFGHYPLQQYLVDIGKGHLQALNIAWDSRPAEQGGQRWFHLQPDEQITSEHPLFWAGHFQNWNSRCAECHVTNYEKNFNPTDMSFASRWSDGNVACEACHGPASKHIELAQLGQVRADNSGFARSKSRSLRWQYQPGDPIANPNGPPAADHINMCGGCHALRMPLAEIKPNADFHDSFRLQLLHQGAYFADGQIQEEVFVSGSFLQSKMHQNGVTCGDCHNPHTGKVKVDGNGLCARCHSPTVFDTPEHHHHRQASSGARCVNCHMPARTYMGVDDRRDHSFTIPRPQLAAAVGAPNACTGCHDDKDNDWTAEVVDGWGVDAAVAHWASVNQQARNLDILATESLIATVLDASKPPIVRASLLSQLGSIPSPESVRAAAAMLQDEDPLLRRAAVSALRPVPIRQRWQLLAPHMGDANRVVRFEIAGSLAEAYSQLPAAQRASLEKLLQEYRQMLSHTLDSLATQLNLAVLELALGNREQALAAYRRALEIAPGYVPALVNLAEFQRGVGNNAEEEKLLARALAVAPDSATVQHAYGLHLVRAKEYAGALPYLKQALALDDSQPRHAYVYAVALDSRGDTKAAIRVLVDAAKRWPNQVDLLLLLVSYMDKTGSTMAIHSHLAALDRIAPESPEVRRLIRKYRLP